MTRQKHFKQLVRARMEKTGERYAAARRHIIAEVTPDASTPAHRPGSVPAAAALATLLASAGVVDPRTRRPFTEPMVFGIAGGIGAGVFSFYYEKADFSSFYIAGRHLWQDDLAYLERGAARFGAATRVWESGGAREAERHLVEAVARGPVIAWVDLAHLPHRAMPLALSGGGYHVIVVYSVDVESRTASIGDLADRPIEIPLDALAEARARIRKQKHRLLAVERVAKQPDLGAALPDAMRACADGLLKGRMKNLTLHSFGTWAGQLRADSGKESWSRMFPPGPRLWRGLTSIYQYIEHYGTGGGLSRPLMAEFLEEAGDGARRRPFHALAARYTDLGRGWSELADQALPSDVPDFARARELLDRKAELVLSGEQGAGDVWTTLDELERRPRAEFPLGDEAADALRGRLAPLVDNLYEAERAAAAELQQLS